jgi:hypothetical protein
MEVEIEVERAHQQEAVLYETMVKAPKPLTM